MIKKFTLSLALIMAGVMIYDAQHNIAHTNGAGAPAGRTGNPGELSGASCNSSGCHVGGPSVSNEVAELTSDIPSTGYEPGQTYTITVTMTKPGGTKFGFEVSPQNGSGSLQGSLSSPGTGAQLIGGSKYVTHTSAGTSGSGSKTWTFNWTAPSVGTGAVTFWGAFNFANGNNSVSGDVIVNDSFTFQEATVSINEINSANEGFSVYPNPVTDMVNVKFNLTEAEDINVELYSLDGKLVSKLAHDNLVAGDHHLTHDLSTVSSGIYFVKISDGTKDHYKKVMVK